MEQLSLDDVDVMESLATYFSSHRNRGALKLEQKKQWWEGSSKNIGSAGIWRFCIVLTASVSLLLLPLVQNF